MRELGVRTVLSVDGAKPDAAEARKFGLRYVHVPFGYDGVPQQKAAVLARAVRNLPGPVYIHCHHGKHRGPAAVAVVLRCLNVTDSTEQAADWLRQAGTDPHYAGLYAAPGQYRLLKPAEVDGAPAEFPEVAAVAALAGHMVAVDERWDNLTLIRAAGWTVPANHADLNPAHEALMLQEAYHEAARLPSTRERSAELHAWLAAAEVEAKKLTAALRTGDGKQRHAAAEQAYQRVAAACVRCHVRYRDNALEP